MYIFIIINESRDLIYVVLRYLCMVQFFSSLTLAANKRLIFDITLVKKIAKTVASEAWKVDLT